MPNVRVSPVHFFSFFTQLKLTRLFYSTGSGCTTTEAILVDDCTTLRRHMAACHKVIFILILFGYSNEFYRHYTGVGARSTISTQCFLKI